MPFLRNDYLGGQPFDEVSTTPQHPLGFIARGQDPDFGNTETDFIYVAGVTGGAFGSVVTVNKRTGATALTAARSKGPLAVLHGALTAGTFGWAAINGSCRVLISGTITAGQQAYLTATPGTLSSTVAVGDAVSGASFASANGVPVAGMAILSLSYPSASDADNA